MSNRSRSSQDLIKEAMKEVAELPPGSDVAGFITKKVRELETLFANEVTETRANASKKAGFSPSPMPSLHAPEDGPGQKNAPKDDRSP